MDQEQPEQPTPILPEKQTEHAAPVEPQEKLAIVKNLRELKTEVSTSKWDVKIKNETIRLVLDPCKCGVHAKWVQSVPVMAMLPPELQAIAASGRVMGLDGKKTIDRVVEDWHWHPTWWQKALRFKMEPALMKWIKTTHQEWLDILKAEDKAEDLRKMIEL